MLTTIAFCTVASTFGQTKIDRETLDSQIASGLIDQHPASYYTLAMQLWLTGRKDESVFWLYAGQLRYRFYLLAHPEVPQPPYPALQDAVGGPINLYAGGDVDKWISQINSVLDWDARTPNLFTSKTEYSVALEEVRKGLLDLGTYLVANKDSLRKQREEQGIGLNGLIDGAYVDERRPKMSEGWPQIISQNSTTSIAGVYQNDFDARLEVIFGADRIKAKRSDSIKIATIDDSTIEAIAFIKGKEVFTKRISITISDGAIVVTDRREGKDTGLDPGYDEENIRLRLNESGELVLQRDSVREGIDGRKLAIKEMYTFWNRAKRVPTP